MKRKRLKKLIEEIKKHPERHNQIRYISGLMERYETWEDESNTYIPERVKEYEGQLINCGTTGCLAGLGSLRYAPVGTKFWGDCLILPDDTEEINLTYHNYGREVLGLTIDEANYLFDAARSMEEIEAFSGMKKKERAKVLYPWR